MTTKRTNDKFHRLDVKIPVGLYEKISSIALNSFDAKIHHISGKPELSPTLLYLLELGIETFTSGNELIKKSDTDNLTDDIPITNDWVKKLIAQELSPIHSKLDELSELVYRLTNTDNNIYVHNLKNTLDVIPLTDTLEVNTDNPIVAIDESDTDNLTDTVESDTNNLTDSLTVNIEEVQSDTLEVKSFEKAVNEISKLSREGLGNTAIARLLTGKYLNKSGTGTKWTDTQVKRILI